MINTIIDGEGLINLVEQRQPISVVEAVKRVTRNRLKRKEETVHISVSDNRRLAEAIVAQHPIPNFDKSPYDGFAIRSEDTIGARESPVQFTVIENIGAGQIPQKPLQKNEATRIMTGAQIPEGADCVAMFEMCHTFESGGQSYMLLAQEMKRGENVIYKGSEVAHHETLVEPGTLINPGVKALLATFGYSEVKVAKKPVVGIIATGSELLDVDEPLAPGKIRNSNAYMIASQVIRAGGDYRYFGKLVDEFDQSYRMIKTKLEEVDMLITTGGVSVGDFDLMPAIYEKLGAQVLFNKVAMRPGSVTTVAVKDGKLLFGLSGNPSACYVGFELFARPIIRHALYSETPFLQRIKATLAEDFPKSNPFTRYVRSFIVLTDGVVKVFPAGMDKSNVVSSLAKTTGLMILPSGTSDYRAGDQVEVLLLDDAEGQKHFT